MLLVRAFILQASMAVAAVIQPRSPQTGAGAPAKGTGNPLAGLAGGFGLLGGGNIASLPPAKLASRQELKPQLRPNAKRIRARYGPITLVGKGQPKPRGPGTGISLDPTGQATSMLITEGLCSDCTILVGETGLVFADGKPAEPAQGIYIHHILSSDITKNGTQTVSMCDTPSFNIDDVTRGGQPRRGAGFIGQGEDNTGNVGVWFTSRDGKYPSGFLVGKNDRFFVTSDLVNSNKESKDVYVVFEIEYVDGHVGTDSAPNLLSVTGCKLGGYGGIQLNKTGPAVTNSQKFPVLVDGHIVAMKGHMHNGGDRMILYINGNSEPVCTSIPTYKDNNINSMSSCDKPVAVKKGDYLTMKTIYDLAKYPLRADEHGNGAHNMMGGDDVMGMWTMTIALDGGAKKI